MEQIAPQPRYSSDWIFLPDIPAEGKALVFARINDGFALPLSKRYREVTFVESKTDETKPFEDTYNLVAMPLGLSIAKEALNAKTLRSVLDTTYNLLKPNGVYYLGFSNIWDIHRFLTPFNNSEIRLSLSRISKLLRKAGFSSATFYGAVSTHKIPERIFSLNPQTVAYALTRQYQHRLPTPILKIINNPLIASGISHFIPSYCVVARR